MAYFSKRLNHEIHFGKLPAQLEHALKLKDFYQIKDTGNTPWGHDTEVTNWGMLGNGPDDTVFPGFQGCGDCTCAGADHEIMLWTAEGGNPTTFTGANTVSDYSALTGYDPQTGNNDNGCVISDVVNYEMQTGMIDSKGIRHKLLAGLSIQTTDLTAFNSAGTDFEAVGIGVAIYQEDMNAFDDENAWSTGYSTSTLLGLHYIPGVKFDGTNYKFTTWAVEQIATPEWVQARWDEAWAKLSQEMLNNGKSIDGLDLAQLQAALQALGGNTPPANPVLSVLSLSGTVPTLTVGVPFDLSTLTLTGADQNGNPLSLSGLTVNWEAASVTADATMVTISGSILTPTMAGGIEIAAVIGNVASNTLGANIVAAAPPAPTPPSSTITTILTIGDNVAEVNGQPVPIDSNPAVVPVIEPDWGRVLLPVRFVAEILGATVTWNQGKQEVTIVTPAPAQAGVYQEIVVTSEQFTDFFNQFGSKK